MFLLEFKIKILKEQSSNDESSYKFHTWVICSNTPHWNHLCVNVNNLRQGYN